METCKICKFSSADVHEGVCDNCEPLWLDKVVEVAKKTLRITNLCDVFKIAAKEAAEEAEDARNDKLAVELLTKS